jgi:phosphoglycolate phosphatase
MQCNICGCSRFTDMPKRPAVRCADCGSLERTRVAALHITEELKPASGAHILHFAPERGLSLMLREIGGPNYRALDIDPDRYPDLGVTRFDLVEDVFDLPRDRYDLIVHNHVLEHVEANYSAVLMRLAGSLSDTGTMLFSVPILPGDFTDELIVGGLQDKLDRFGPSLHVRRFSVDTLQRTLGMLFPIPDAYDLRERFDEALLTACNIPPHHWTNFTGATVFGLRKQDLRC